MRHKLKTLKRYYDAQINGLKPFEMRKNDRDFSTGDELLLEEIDSTDIAHATPTGRACILEITYILSSSPDSPFEGIEVGYAVLGTRMVCLHCSRAYEAFGH